MAENITTLCKNAANLLASFPSSTTIRVVSHYDADGIAAAGVLCTMLYRQGYDFHCSLMRNPFTKGFDRLKNEQNRLIIFADMGSGQLETIEQLGCPAIVLDHHQYLTEKTSKNIIQINANLCGIDGNYEASGATLAYALATTLNVNNEDLASLALAGATGDKQHFGGIRGFNKTILDRAIQKNILSEQTSLKLYGETIADALFYSIDPYYQGLSGNKEAIQETLKKLSLDPDTNMGALDAATMMRLQSFLLFYLIRKGCTNTIIESTIRKRYVSTSQDWELERFADLLDACGKNGYRSLGLSLCLGNGQSWNEAISVEQDYKQKILNGLHRLDNKGLHEAEGLTYFYSDSSSLGGVIAGIAMNYVLDGSKPLFSLAKKEEEHEVHVSCRGTQQLVHKGLDLGAAMKTIATELDGYGGGHKIAAGATIALEREQEFLEKVNNVLVQQLRGTP